MNRPGIMPALFTALVLGTALAGAPSLERDAVLQERIAAVVAAVVQEPDKTQDRVQALREAAAGRRETLLLQLALFLSASDSTEEGMVGAMLVHGLEFSPEEKLTAVVPHLDASDAALRRALDSILETVDRPQGGAPDFIFYEQWLRQHGRDPSAPLIRYMYRVSPAMAVASMNRVFGSPGTVRPDAGALVRLEALLAEHEGRLAWSEENRVRAGALLEQLSQDPAWWMRLYAAATLQQEPQLATPTIRARLAVDPEALVRGAVPR